MLGQRMHQRWPNVGKHMLGQAQSACWDNVGPIIYVNIGLTSDFYED